MSRRIASALLLSASLAASLAACSTPAPPQSRFPDIAFTQYPPFRLAVSRVDVVQDYQAPGQKPNIESEFPTPPARIAERWAFDRLQNAGGPHIARYVIRDASARQVPLPRTGGVRGYFTTDQAYRFDAAIVVEMQILNPVGVREGQVSAEARRSRTIAEDASPADRERTLNLIAEDLARDLNAELDRNVRSHLARFVR